MKPEQLTEVLETAAGQIGVRVRYETLGPATGGMGGLCRIHGDWCVIIDKKATPSERVSILMDALAGLDTEGVYLPPKVREVLSSRRAARPAAPTV